MSSVERGSKKKRTVKAAVVGILPDLHIPKEDGAAVEWAVRELKDFNLTKLILLGDVISLDSVSRFQKSLSVRSSLPTEVARGAEFLQYLERKFPKIPKVYLQGNHEHRLSSYLLRHAPELGELPTLMFRQLLQVPQHWEVLDYGDFIKVEGFLVQHGRSWGQNAARRNLFLGCSVVQGHSHRYKVLAHRCAGSGQTQISCELGCLCDFDQGYSKLTDWSHAYGVITQQRLMTAVRY